MYCIAKHEVEAVCENIGFAFPNCVVGKLLKKRAKIYFPDWLNCRTHTSVGMWFAVISEALPGLYLNHVSSLASDFFHIIQASSVLDWSQMVDLLVFDHIKGLLSPHLFEVILCSFTRTKQIEASSEISQHQLFVTPHLLMFLFLLVAFGTNRYGLKGKSLGQRLEAILYSSLQIHTKCNYKLLKSL